MQPDLLIPADVVEEIEKTLGNPKAIIPVIHEMVNSGKTTWDAVRCALHNLRDGVLKFTYVRPLNDFGNAMPKGGCAVVFQLPPRKTDRILTIATSWCHDRDTFNPKLGRLIAAIHYVHDRTTQLRLPSKGKYSSQLKSILNPCVNNFRFE